MGREPLLSTPSEFHKLDRRQNCREVCTVQVWLGNVEGLACLLGRTRISESRVFIHTVSLVREAVDATIHTAPS